MMDYSSWHSTPFKVRDYECDLQGRVNNSVYGNYFEHARHELLLFKRIDFAFLCEQNIHLVVSRIEIDYRRSLRSRDSFVVCTKTYLQGRLKMIFQQDLLLVENEAFEHVKIFSLDDAVLCASAKVTGVAVNEKGKPFLADFFTQLS